MKSTPEIRAAVIVGGALPMCVGAPTFLDAAFAGILFSIMIVVAKLCLMASRRVWGRSCQWFVLAFVLAALLQAVSFAGDVYCGVWMTESALVIPAILVSALIWAGFGLIRKSTLGDRLQTWLGIIVVLLSCGAFREYFAMPNTVIAGVFMIMVFFISIFLTASFSRRVS